MTTRPTRVLVNLTWLVPGVVGGSEDSLTDAMRAIRDDPPDDLDIRLAVLRPFLAAHPDLASPDCSVLGLDGSDKARRVLAEQTWLAREARRVGADVVHHAGGVVPLVHPGRVVLTVQDLQPLDMPENFSVVKRAYIRAMAGRSARAAATVCVPSEFTRRRVVELLGVAADRVQVVPWFVRPAGPEPGERPGPLPVPLAELLSDGRPYFLYPAITYPHKEHAVLLDAFARVAEQDAEAALVLTGGEGPSESLVRERIARPDLRGRVLRTGRVPAATLEALYAGATAVTVPSRYEGFGLPALEAMSRGCVLLASDAGSLPEVAGADDLVEVGDVTAWAGAMQSVLALSDADRAARIDAGRERAARFTPQRTASGLLQAYRRAASVPN